MGETLENYSPRLLVELHPLVAGVDAILQYVGHLKALGYNPDWVLDTGSTDTLVVFVAGEDQPGRTPHGSTDYHIPESTPYAPCAE